MYFGKGLPLKNFACYPCYKKTALHKSAGLKIYYQFAFSLAAFFLRKNYAGSSCCKQGYG